MRPPAGGDKPRPYNTGYVPFQGPRRGFGGKRKPRRKGCALPPAAKGTPGHPLLFRALGPMPSSARGRVWAPAPTAQGAPHLRGPRANPAKRFAWGKGGPAAGMSVRARPEASDPKLGLTLSRCGGCATPHCLPLREKHLAPAAQLLFRLRGSLCGCSARLRASCHAAGWAHGRVAKRPFREKCRRASPGLFFRLHVLLAPLCAYPPRF